MSETIRYLDASLNQREEEKQQVSEMVDLLRDELIQVREKNHELVEINNKLQREVKNLSESLAALVSDDCEEHNTQLQKRVTELQEQKQNLSSVLMKERQEAAEREESTRNEMNQTAAMQEAYHSLDLYCPVVNHKTKERNCKRCPDSWRLFENKCYYFSSRTLTWGSSRAWCQTQGGDLLVIDSEPEQIFIFESSRALQQSGSRLWIGMTDAEVEGEWSWVDGSSVTSNRQYWLSRPGIGTEPDDWKQDDPLGEDCGHIDTSENTLTSWMDGSCKNPYGWICEKDV
ncbi:C-type lectin domain family 4 member E-like [Tautogolabrus adspersus]